jgi:hypothetical protein
MRALLARSKADAEEQLRGLIKDYAGGEPVDVDAALDFARLWLLNEEKIRVGFEEARGVREEAWAKRGEGIRAELEAACSPRNTTPGGATTPGG